MKETGNNTLNRELELLKRQTVLTLAKGGLVLMSLIGAGVLIDSDPHCGFIGNVLVMPKTTEIYKGVMCVDKNGTPLGEFGWVTDKAGNFLRLSE